MVTIDSNSDVELIRSQLDSRLVLRKDFFKSLKFKASIFIS